MLENVKNMEKMNKNNKNDGKEVKIDSLIIKNITKKLKNMNLTTNDEVLPTSTDRLKVGNSFENYDYFNSLPATHETIQMLQLESGNSNKSVSFLHDKLKSELKNCENANFEEKEEFVKV